MATTTKKAMRMHNPPHPGEILSSLYMEPIGVSVTRVADAIGVSRKHVSAIVNGHAAITADVAVRLAAAFGTEPEVWVNLQTQYDLWQARQQERPRIKSLAIA